MLTKIYKNNPTHHKGHNCLAPRNLVEYVGAWKLRAEYCVYVGHAKHEREGHWEGREKADAHCQVPDMSFNLDL